MDAEPMTSPDEPSVSTDAGADPGADALKEPRLPARAVGGRAALKLTEFLDLATLQDIQDSLAMVAQVKATILDTAGQALTQTTVSERFSSRSAAIVASRKQKGDTDLDQPFSAPIIVNDEKLGTIVMEPAKAAPLKASQIARLAKKLDMPVDTVKTVIDAMNEEGMGQRHGERAVFVSACQCAVAALLAGDAAPPAYSGTLGAV